MTSRERVVRALTFESPDRAPRELWVLPGVEMNRKEELAALLAKYPGDFDVPPSLYGPSSRAGGVPHVLGSYTDEWGCRWDVMEEGTAGEVKAPPLAEWSQLGGFTAPWEILEQANLERVNAVRGGSTRFVRAATPVRLFERLQFLRGPENLLMDLAELSPGFFRLRDLVHEFFLEEIRLWSKTDVDGVAIMDDWGTQRNMLIAPEVWRQVFKPCYRQYCDTLKRAGKFVFFHSDGMMEPIIEDLIEIGVEALNSQLFCMNIEQLAQRFKGRLTFWGEMDRQQILPFGTPDDVRAAVRRVRNAFDDGRGGLIAQCEWGLNDPRENVEAVFEAWK